MEEEEKVKHPLNDKTEIQRPGPSKKENSEKQDEVVKTNLETPHYSQLQTGTLIYNNKC